MQGPFTVDRIQGLLRRGRFSRHFHVSEDKKEWAPAQDFPELFAGVGRGGGSSDDDDEVFHGGGSPFDDDDDEDMAPTRAGRGSGGRKRRRPADDEAEDDDDDDELEEDDDDDSGVLTGALDWVEDNSKALAAVLVLLLVGLGWFMFGRESFTQDAADLDVLLEVKSKISTAHTLGTDAANWQQLTDTTIADLKPLVERLNETASSRDHIKQELLFSSRDEIPKMFDELPRGTNEAAERIMLRFSRIDRMIKAEVRFDKTSVLSLPPKPAPVPQPQSDAAAEQPQTPPSTSLPAEAVDPEQPAQTPPPQQNTMPQPNPTSSGQPTNTSGGVPGRPAPAKF